jgi:signal transduction histidine kinase
MIDEGDRLIRLVNDLLLLAHTDAGRSLAKKETALLSIIEKAVRQAKYLDPSRILIFLSKQVFQSLETRMGSTR